VVAFESLHSRQRCDLWKESSSSSYIKKIVYWSLVLVQGDFYL
jgi:hypothetical protein